MSDEHPSGKALLRARGLTPKKHFGQNFLVEPNIARKIAVAATTPEGGTVLEIGPGLGALTEHLAARAAHVVAVERDPDMADILVSEVFASTPREKLEIVQANALDEDWRARLVAGPRPRVVAGNLPYSITGLLIERAVAIAADLDRAVFMVQLEVAERLIARPSTKDYGALTVFTQAAFAVERLLVARAHLFHPRPNVDSAVVVLTPLAEAERVAETDRFRALVKAGFQARRKTLRNAWRADTLPPFDVVEAAARSAGIDLERRAETLSAAEFGRVARALDRP